MLESKQRVCETGSGQPVELIREQKRTIWSELMHVRIDQGEV